MGFLKKVWRAIKGVVRQVARIVVELIHRLILGLPDLLFGFLAWPTKKIRIKILILSDENGNPTALPADLTPSIDYATRVFKDRLNVRLVTPSRGEAPIVEVISTPAPAAALDVHCDASGWGEEFGEAGEYFAGHLAGLVYRITVFVVRDIADKEGCSLGPLTDYITLDPDGVKSENTLAHEIGHSCGLWHSGSQSNLMWPDDNRGDGVKWFQKHLFRSSRHVTYW